MYEFTCMNSFEQILGKNKHSRKESHSQEVIAFGRNVVLRKRLRPNQTTLKIAHSNKNNHQQKVNSTNVTCMIMATTMPATLGEVTVCLQAIGRRRPGRCRHPFQHYFIEVVRSL